jgi:hypothetical protein
MSDDAEAAAALEKFRQSGIRIDRDGRFWHEGGEIEHPRMLATFRRWLDRLPDQRYVLRLDTDRYVYVDVDDAPLVASSLRWDGDRAYLMLPDGVEEELAYPTLRYGEKRGAYAEVREGRLDAHLSPQAWSQLAEHVVDTPAGPVLEAHGQRYPISLL